MCTLRAPAGRRVACGIQLLAAATDRSADRLCESFSLDVLAHTRAMRATSDLFGALLGAEAPAADRADYFL